MVRVRVRATVRVRVRVKGMGMGMGMLMMMMVVCLGSSAAPRAHFRPCCVVLADSCFLMLSVAPQLPCSVVMVMVMMMVMGMGMRVIEQSRSCFGRSIR